MYFREAILRNWKCIHNCVSNGFVFDYGQVIIVENIHFSVTHFQFKNGRSHAMTFFFYYYLIVRL